MIATLASICRAPVEVVVHDGGFHWAEALIGASASAGFLLSGAGLRMLWRQRRDRVTTTPQGEEQ